MAQKCTKIVENDENRNLFGLCVIGIPEILLKLFTKLRPGLVIAFHPYFSKNLGFGVQKTSKEVKNVRK